MTDERLHPVHLTIRARTPHGVPIHGATIEIHSGGVIRRAMEEDGEYQVALPRPGDYQLVAERTNKAGGFDHRTLRATLFYVFTAKGPLLRHLTAPENERTRITTVEGEGGRFLINVTLDYLWFTHIGYPPTRGNKLELLVDGNAGWGVVASAVASARESILLATWFYEPTTELIRPVPLADPKERAGNTVHEILEERADDGVTVRLLPWNAPVLCLPQQAQQAAKQANDNFEVMEQDNPTTMAVLPGGELNPFNQLLDNFQIGSYHQKTVVVDGKVGFCGGMNLKENDWDTRSHAIFDPRRCRFERDSRHRRKVDAREKDADHKPRHDYIARMEGPAVHHLEENFRQRWNHLIDHGAKWSQNATAMPPPAPAAAFDDGVAVQVVRTMPEPFTERGILDVHVRALRAARRLIYIEDQYFRSTHVSDAIADTVREWPDIRLVVVTLRSQADDFFAGGWSREAFERIQRRRPDFELYVLQVSGVDARGKHQVKEIDNHAKLMIVDDLFLSVGSCNINDRGFEFEGEINIAVVDPEQVKAARLDIWREHLADDPRLSGDIENDTQVWNEHAEENGRFEIGAADQPRSNVFPFTPRSDREILTGSDVL